MNGILWLALPRPPSIWALYGTAKNGRKFRSEKYNAWRAACWGRVQDGDVVKGPYVATILVPRKDARKTDIDNYIKPVIDVLVDLGVTEDDHLMESIHARWVPKEEGPDIRVSISETSSSLPLPASQGAKGGKPPRRKKE